MTFYTPRCDPRVCGERAAPISQMGRRRPAVKGTALAPVLRIPDIPGNRRELRRLPRGRRAPGPQRGWQQWEARQPHQPLEDPASGCSPLCSLRLTPGASRSCAELAKTAFKLFVNVRDWAPTWLPAPPGCGLGPQDRLLPLHTAPSHCGDQGGLAGSCLGAFYLRRKPTQKSRDRERLLSPCLKPLDPARPEVPDCFKQKPVIDQCCSRFHLSLWAQFLSLWPG